VRGGAGGSWEDGSGLVRSASSPLCVETDFGKIRQPPVQQTRRRACGKLPVLVEAVLAKAVCCLCVYCSRRVMEGVRRAWESEAA